MNAVSHHHDTEIINRLRQMIHEGKSDHWIGMQARLLIGQYDAGWVDSGSGPGYSVGTAWERHDDPELGTSH